MKRIFVDARMMGPDVSRGIGRVVREFLLRALTDGSVEWVVLVRKPAQLEGLPGRFRAVVRDIPWYGFREQLEVAWIAWRSGAHFAFFPHWNVPVLSPLPFACFIHDLILFHHAESAKISHRHPLHAWLKRLAHRALVHVIAWRAETLFTPTAYVAAELCTRFPAASGRVVVAGEGVSGLSVPGVGPAGSPIPYVLTVGGAYPHKRLDLVIDAWERLAAVFPTHTLVMVGEDDLFREALREEARRRGLPRIVFPGAVSDAELAGWYAQADLLVFPSEDEGFGLPPLEALSLGCPVLASDAACLPEVLPRAGVRFFRNGDLNDMMERWKEMVGDLPACRAETAAGFADAARRHSWEGMVRRIRSHLPIA